LPSSAILLSEIMLVMFILTFMHGNQTLLPQRTHTTMKPRSYHLCGQIHCRGHESQCIWLNVGGRGRQMASGSVPRQSTTPQQINDGSPTNPQVHRAVQKFFFWLITALTFDFSLHVAQLQWTCHWR
jgi:hypothetical protein